MRIELATRQRVWGGGEVLLADIAAALERDGHRVGLRAPAGSELARRCPQYAGRRIDAPELIVANDFRTLWQAALRHPRARKAFLCHGWWQTGRLRNAVCRVCRARVFVVSEAVRAAVLAGGWDLRPQLLPVGPDPDRFAPPEPGRRAQLRRTYGVAPDVLVAAWVGRYQRVKRPALFVDAAAALGAHAVLVVPASAHTDEEREVREQVRALGRRPGVTLLEGADPREAYWAADVLISTSEFESLGLAMLEALACGLPVVTTAAGGPADFRCAAVRQLAPTAGAPEIAGAAAQLLAAERGAISAAAVAAASQRGAAQAARMLVARMLVARTSVARTSVAP